jgi:molybdenum cofactor synthesis domain-containing protein
MAQLKKLTRSEATSKMLESINLDDAVGLVLAHDITEIWPGAYKGPAFQEGHIIQEADICHLQRLGKRHVYAINLQAGYLHENEAALRLTQAFCGPGVDWQGEPREGKLNLIATLEGLLKVDRTALTRINLLGEVMCATRHTNTVVKAGEVVAATRAIPLIIRSQVIEQAERLVAKHHGLVRVKPLKKARVGIVITGNEVFTGLIKDKFEPVLRKKLAGLNCTILGVTLAPDDSKAISEEIRRFLEAGADLILTTGGMSVDPDDVTRLAIRQAGAKKLVYGASVIPGAMFLAAYLDNVPVLGIPACGIYHEITILDLVLPRILAGERLTRKDIAVWGHGGLCLHCQQCHYPNCSFGKGAA